MKPPSRVLIAVLAALAVLALAGAPAVAHGGEGEVEITSIAREGDLVTVTARLTYVEDGHGVPDATVTVVVGEGTPIPMEAGAEEGDYTATVPATPGTPLRVTSVEPATSVDGAAPETDGSPATTEAGSTTSEGETATTGDGPTTQASADTVPEPNGVDEAPVDDEGNSGTTVVLVVVVVVVVAAIGAGFLLRRKRPGEV